MTPERVAGLLEGWNRNGEGGLPHRLAVAIGRAVEIRLLPPGVRMPTERTLAELLAVSRSTVAGAYDLLRSRDVLQSRQGSGTWVRDGRSSAAAVGSEFLDQALETGINLAASVMPACALPAEAGLTIEDLMIAQPAHGYAPRGLPDLRAFCAGLHSRAGGPAIPADEIVITTGATNALALSLMALAQPGDSVLVDSPTYPGLLAICKALRLVPVPLPGDRYGPHRHGLRSACAQRRPAALVLQPAIANPTGRAIAAARLAGLRAIAADASVPVIEDNSLAPLAFADSPRPMPAVGDGPGVSIGSFSKLLWGGLRIGWLQARGEVLEKIAGLAGVLDIGIAVPSQHLVLAAAPRFDNLLERRRAELRKRCRQAGSLLALHLPETRFAAPAGGLSLWLDTGLPDSGPFVRLARRFGVAVLEGSLFRADGAPDGHLRLCFDRPEAVLETGIVRLGDAWRAYREL